MQYDRQRRESENSWMFRHTGSRCFCFEPCLSCSCSVWSSYARRRTGWKQLSVSTEWPDCAVTACGGLYHQSPVLQIIPTVHVLPAEAHRSRSKKKTLNVQAKCRFSSRVAEVLENAMWGTSISAGKEDDHFLLKIKIIFLFYNSF